MTKIILFIWLAFAPLFLRAQETLFQLLKSNETEFQTQQFQLSGDIIKFETENAEASNIEMILVDIADQTQLSEIQLKEILETARKTGFDDYMEIRDNPSKVNILAKTNATHFTALLLQVQGDSSIIHIYLEGNFQFKDLEHLNLDIEGMDQLKKAASKA